VGGAADGWCRGWGGGAGGAEKQFLPPLFKYTCFKNNNIVPGHPCSKKQTPPRKKLLQISFGPFFHFGFFLRLIFKKNPIGSFNCLNFNPYLLFVFGGGPLCRGGGGLFFFFQNFPRQFLFFLKLPFAFFFLRAAKKHTAKGETGLYPPIKFFFLFP